MALPSASTAPFDCPVCGAPVPANARACPACGADDRTGWDAEATRYDGLDLPEQAFSEDESPDGQSGTARRRGQGLRPPVRAMLLIAATAALVVLVILIIGLLHHRS